MANVHGRTKDVERRLYQALQDAGSIIPKTPDEVALMQAKMASDTVELPRRLQNGLSVLGKTGSSVDDDLDVFGRLIRTLRVEKKYSTEKLAAEARIGVEEVEKIEAVLGYEPKPRTVLQLAAVLGVAPKPLAKLAGLTSQEDKRLVDGAVKFAACSKSIDGLSSEHRQALREFVRLLNSLE